jgi:hypothetical protein
MLNSLLHLQEVYDEIKRVYGSQTGEPPLGPLDALYALLTCVTRLAQLVSICVDVEDEARAQRHLREICRLMVQVCVLRRARFSCWYTKQPAFPRQHVAGQLDPCSLRRMLAYWAASQ